MQISQRTSQTYSWVQSLVKQYDSEIIDGNCSDFRIHGRRQGQSIPNQTTPLNKHDIEFFIVKEDDIIPFRRQFRAVIEKLTAAAQQARYIIVLAFASTKRGLNAFSHNFLHTLDSNVRLLFCLSEKHLELTVQLLLKVIYSEYHQRMQEQINLLLEESLELPSYEHILNSLQLIHLTSDDCSLVSLSLGSLAYMSECSLEDIMNQTPLRKDQCEAIFEFFHPSSNLLQ